MSDCIIYGQAELKAAIDSGKKHITLCVGIFNIPKAPGVVFDCIGPVKVKLDCSRAEADEVGMRFNGIYPEFKKDYAVSERALMKPVAVTFGGSGSSFGSGAYLSGSYGSGSYGSGSYGSHITSYRFSATGAGSLAGSAAYIYAQTMDKPIYVFGYGVDLI